MMFSTLNEWLKSDADGLKKQEIIGKTMKIESLNKRKNHFESLTSLTKITYSY